MIPDNVSLELRKGLWNDMADEVDRAYRKHGSAQWGRHEFYAILLEEVDEVWDAIKQDLPQDELIAEIVQVAAMCLRYTETGDRYRQPFQPT